MLITAYAIRQIITENSEPSGAAIPMGKSVSANLFESMYAPGTRTKIIDSVLCRNDNPDFSMAQKYPLKLKWIPANMQSQM